ncbi:hypothetical protein NPX13_g9258 [Xylaria arbuscula]|uniref:Fungal-type protein kinase domain-containing protein n=1 Tax=Xylaria arbuscula TaxID=114810 RepID=A0A9W8TIM4_9PEZI|nr:hypothetical protein NPX13_g9258 [Xylaria arbuscula]
MTSILSSLSEDEGSWSKQCLSYNRTTGTRCQEANTKLIADDIDGHIYVDVKGFYAKYFGPKAGWAPTQEITQTTRAKSVRAQGLQPCDNSQTSPMKSSLLQHKAQNNRSASVAAQYAWIDVHKSSCPLSSNSTALVHLSNSNKIPTWADVRVIGEFTNSYGGLLQLCENARAVFTHQPDRLFLHGFHMAGNVVELWMFDRSGAYVCETFGMDLMPNRFLNVLSGYLAMSDDELGLSNLIKEDEVGKYILSSTADMKVNYGEKLYLRDPPIFARLNKKIMSDGLTCYSARREDSEDWEFVVKLKWSASTKNTEAKILEQAEKRGVRGVLRTCYYQEICRIKDLHHGLSPGVPRKLKYVGSQHRVLSGEPTAAQTSGYAVETSIPTRDTSDSTSLGFVDDKIFNILVLHPLGKSLHHFHSVPELLASLCDAIRGHQSLYQVGNILHRDISPSNIITTSGKSRRGIRIDLDTAKDLSTGSGSEQYESNGTPFFKSIGVLQAYLPDNPHTYRHDLESFFYTFLFLATCPRPVPPGENQLQLPPDRIISSWTSNRPVDQAKRKIESISDDDEFARIVAEFTPEFRGLGKLAEKLRMILFPVRNGKRWTGTDMTADGTNALYADILNAFGGEIGEHSTKM